METGSFDSFFEDTHQRLYTALCLVTADRYEAEEIAQEAFLKVFERWDTVARMDDPTGYLFRAAMNVFRNRYRRAALALKRGLSLAPRAVDDLAAVETRERPVEVKADVGPGHLFHLNQNIAPERRSINEDGAPEGAPIVDTRAVATG